MEISVVIPSYNRRHTLGRALQSIADQTSKVDEIILVDDGSTDGSSELVRQHFPEVRILKQPNLGVSAARNRGIVALLNKKMCDWSDDDWKRLKKAYARTCKK